MTAGLKDASVADLEKLVRASLEGGDPAAGGKAMAELEDRAQEGDTASRRVLAKLTGPAGDVEGALGLTLPGIADAVLTELGRICLKAWPPASLDEAQGFAALAGAFRDVDAVLARIRADEPAPLAPTLEAFLTAAWDESQKAGVAIDVADQVVGKLRLRLSADG